MSVTGITGLFEENNIWVGSPTSSDITPENVSSGIVFFG